MDDNKTLDEKIKDKFSPYFKINEYTNIKHIVAIMSGKGGVGKSFVTAMISSAMQKKGYKVGILDADITGPSIPHSFGIHDKITGTSDSKLVPLESKNGIKMVSLNLMLDKEDDAVVWRGPVLAQALEQFYSDTYWGELDYLFIDMPPGTSDVALTIYKRIPVDGVILVTTPQDLVSMIVGKAVNMAELMKINVIGMVENMAYIKCPCCGEEIHQFGESKLNEVCNEYHIMPLASIPLDPDALKMVDNGLVEDIDSSYFENVCDELKEI